MPQGEEEWYREFEQSHELPQGYDNWGEFWETARQVTKGLQKSAGLPEKTSGTYLKKWAERQAERQPGYKETHDDMSREIRKSGKGGDRLAPSAGWERRYRERTEQQKKERAEHIKNKRQGHQVMRPPDPPNPEWVREAQEADPSYNPSGAEGALEGGRYADNNKIGDILSEMEARGAASLSPEEFIDQVMLEVEQSGYQASADEIIDKYYQEYVGEDEQSFDEDAASEIDKKLVRPAERELDTTMRRIERGVPDVLGKVPLVGDSLKKHAAKAIAKDPLPKSDRYSQGWEDASLDAEGREAASDDEFLEGSGSGRTKDFRGHGQGDPGAREGMGSEGYQGDALREAARKLMPERGGFWSDMIGSISPEVAVAQEGMQMATEPQGPDIQPMDQREKDAQAIKAESAAKMGDIQADIEYHDHLDRKMEDQPWENMSAREKWGTPQRAYDEGDFDPEDWPPFMGFQKDAGDADYQEGDPGEMPEGGPYENWKDAVETDPSDRHPWPETDFDRMTREFEENPQDFVDPPVDMEEQVRLHKDIPFDEQSRPASKYDYDNPFEEKPGQPGQDEEVPMGVRERDEPYEEREPPKKKPIGFLKNKFSRAERAGKREADRLKRASRRR